MIAMFVVVPALVGPLFGSSSAATPPEGGSVAYTDGNWTIYETGGGRYYTHNSQSDQYLAPTGVSPDVYYYNALLVARDVLDAYLRHQANTTDGTAPQTFQYDPNSTATNGTDAFWNTNGAGNTADGTYPTGDTQTQDGDGPISYITPSGSDTGDSSVAYITPSGSTDDPIAPVTDNDTQRPGERPPLHGGVYDNARDPIANATVTIVGIGWTTTTNESGAYAFDYDPPRGEYTVTVQHNNISTAGVDISVTADGAITVERIRRPGHAGFTQDDSGLARNRLDLLLPSDGTPQPIRLWGIGTAMQAPIEFANGQNADSAMVTLAGTETTTTTQRAMAANTSTTLAVDGNTAPSDQRLTLTSTLQTVAHSVTGTVGSGSQFEIPNVGNLSPQNLSIIADGRNSTTERAIAHRTQAGPTTVTVNGSKPATDARVRLTGNVTSGPQTQTTYQGVTPGESVTYDVFGNTNGSSFAVTVTGDTTTTDRSATGTGSGSIENSGNTNTSADVTVSGTTVDLGTETKSGSFSGGGTQDVTITVDGNTDAQNVQLDLTGDESDPNLGSTDSPYLVKDVSCSVEVYPVAGSDWNSDSADCIDYSPSVEEVEVYHDVSVDSDATWYKGYNSIDYDDDNGPTLDFNVDYNRYGDYYWRVDWKALSWQHDYSEARADGSGVSNPIVWSFSKDDSDGSVDFDYTEEYTESGDVDIDISTYVNADKSDTDSQRIHTTTRVYEIVGPGTTTVNVDGSEEASTHLGPNDSTTLDLGDLSPGTHTLSIETEHSVSTSYTASWDEHNSTSDLAVDVGDDGSDEITRSELSEGETASTTVTIPPGTTPIAIDADGPDPDWSADWTDRTRLDTPALHTDTDGQPERTWSGTIPDGETRTYTQSTIDNGSRSIRLEAADGQGTLTVSHTPRNTTAGVTVDVHDNGSIDGRQTSPVPAGTTATVSLGELAPGNRTLDVRADRGGLNYTLIANERSVTQNLTITHQNHTVCEQDGDVEGTVTCTLPDDALAQQDSYQFDVESDGAGISYNTTYDARTVPEQATVTINGTTYRYPEDFDSDGPIRPGDEPTTDIEALTTGTNAVDVTTTPVEGRRPNLTARLEYAGNRMVTREPTVTVTNGGGGTHSMAVPDDELQDGYLYGETTLDLPDSWFSTGENTVWIRTADNSTVDANVTAQGLYRQNRTLKPVG
jgi:hypothetical protein